MKIQSKSEAETKAIGRKVGERLQRGDVVCLCGELGSGKTTMVKGIASVFGIDERDITSPSFTIIAEHNKTVPFYHIDLYRVGNGRVADLGLEEYLGRDGISVIEWAEKAEREGLDENIRITFNYAGSTEREIEIVGIEL